MNSDTQTTENLLATIAASDPNYFCSAEEYLQLLRLQLYDVSQTTTVPSPLDLALAYDAWLKPAFRIAPDAMDVLTE